MKNKILRKDLWSKSLNENKDCIITIAIKQTCLVYVVIKLWSLQVVRPLCTIRDIRETQFTNLYPVQIASCVYDLFQITNVHRFRKGFTPHRKMFALFQYTVVLLIVS